MNVIVLRSSRLHVTVHYLQQILRVNRDCFPLVNNV